MSFTRKRFKVLGSLVLALMLTITCITPAFAADVEPTWTPVASLLSERASYALEEINGKIYVFGGLNGKGSNLNTVEEYNPSTDAWTAKRPMPGSGYDLSSTVLDGKIYIIGGEYALNKPFDKMYIYNPTTDTWATKNLLTNRCGAQVETVGGKIYVIGGFFASGVTNSVEAYDPTADAWETKAPMKTSRTNFRTTVVNGKMYAIGGIANRGTFANTFSSVEEFDTVTNKWTEKASMHAARAFHELAVINNKIYVIGGANGSEGNLTAVEAYDPETNTWADKAPMLAKRQNFQVAATNDSIYVIGYNSIPEQYNPATNTWKNTAPTKSVRCNFKIAFLDNSIYAVGGSNNAAPGNLSSVEKYTLPAVDPAAPTTLTAAAGDAKVDLSWGSVTGATGYNVYRSTTAGGPYTNISEGITATTYTDSTVTNGTTYYYVVTAVTSGSESAYSNEASATPKKSQSEAGFAILDIYMVDGTLKEYDLPMAKVNEFIEWYDQRAAGTGKSYFIIEKTYNKGPFKARKDYIVFDKIKDFEVNQYD